jgi:precorrin-2/cobalt-factor-2 C20-methyltransferase
MSIGILYGIGVGPGDPDLLTVKAARILANITHVFEAKQRRAARGIAGRIARRHISSMVQEVLRGRLNDQTRITGFQSSLRDS